MLKQAYSIVPFAPHHAPGIARLEQQCFSEPWSQAAILESALCGTLFVVALAEDTVIGYGGVQIAADEGYITNIAVDTAYRRKGVGDALTKALIAASKEKNLAFISLEVRVSNTAAQALYQNNGFTLQGRRKNFYRQPVEDALILTNFLKD